MCIKYLISCIKLIWLSSSFVLLVDALVTLEELRSTGCGLLDALVLVAPLLEALLVDAFLLALFAVLFSFLGLFASLISTFSTFSTVSSAKVCAGSGAGSSILRLFTLGVFGKVQAMLLFLGRENTKC